MLGRLERPDISPDVLPRPIGIVAGEITKVLDRYTMVELIRIQTQRVAREATLPHGNPITLFRVR
jgi:hypothetical protein